MATPTAQQINAGLRGFDRLYGLELSDYDEQEVRATVRVREELKQPAGLLHGGVFAAVAESLASLATWLGVANEGKTAVGMSNSTSFLRPVTEGVVHARAAVLHRGRTTWVWDVEFNDDAGRLCAVTRMTIAVRSAQGPSDPSAVFATGA
jgi:1,4-dihydroxy-2-naphthoyl-CoA hydrolase